MITLSADSEEGILHCEEGVDLLPSNIELSATEVNLVNTMSRETVLKTYLEEIKDGYDDPKHCCQVPL